MLNAVRYRRHTRRRAQHIECESNCGITDGVHDCRNAAIGRCRNGVSEVIRFQNLHTAIAGVFIRFAHPCRARAERAVQKHLHTTNANPVATEPATQPQPNRVR
jgi:hypothetical protein